MNQGPGLRCIFLSSSLGLPLTFFNSELSLANAILNRGWTRFTLKNVLGTSVYQPQ